MADALRMQVICCRGDTAGNTQGAVVGEAGGGGIDVATAGVEAGQGGQVHERRVDQFHDQASGLLGVPRHATQNFDQVGMLAGGNAGIHFIERRTIAGHAAFVQLDRNRVCRLARSVPLRLVNDPRRAFAQFLPQLKVRPLDVRGVIGFSQGAGVFTQRIPGVGQPAQARQGQHGLRQFGELVGCQTDQFQTLAPGQAGR